MSKRDFYDVLGVSREADADTIKKAYRGLAMKYHPDRNPDDAQAVERMKEINEAYAVLNDGEKRRLYDTYGHAGLQGFTQEDIFRGADFGSIFEGLFGGGFGFGGGIFDEIFRGRSYGGTRRRRGADLKYGLKVTLEDVYSGKEEVINLRRTETCSTCSGKGAKKDGIRVCESCRGTGQMVSEQRRGGSVFRQISVCGRCRGKGEAILDPCEECRGKGAVDRSKDIKVHVPKGMDSGHAIRISGEGEPGSDGAAPGDLYIVLTVEDHDVFERHGDDIYVAKEIDFPLAALGGKIKDVPSLDGKVSIDIPAGTQTGSIFKVPNKGMPRLKGHGHGDEYVVVKVQTPTDLSREEKDLLKNLQKLRDKKGR